MSVVHNVHYHTKSGLTTFRLCQKDGTYITKSIELDILPVHVEDNPDVILKSEYDQRLEVTEPVVRSSAILKSLRSAAVCGVTLGLPQGPGQTPIPIFEDVVCTMGYDMGLKSLPLPQDGVTCASIWCTCGFVRSYQTLRPDLPDKSRYFPTTSALCRALHRDVREHKPIWFVGYNSYRLDNLFFSYWDRDQSYLKVIDKSPSKSTLLVLYEEGINNVDVYPIVDASFRSRFSSLRH